MINSDRNMKWKPYRWAIRKARLYAETYDDELAQRWRNEELLKLDEKMMNACFELRAEKVPVTERNIMKKLQNLKGVDDSIMFLTEFGFLDLKSDTIWIKWK